MVGAFVHRNSSASTRHVVLARDPAVFAVWRGRGSRSRAFLGAASLRSMLRNAAPALGTLLLSACASTSAAPAFRDTSRLVEAGTGHPIFWNQGGAADAAVARRVRDLLDRDLSVDAAIQIALLNNKDLQALYEDLSLAQADLVQAGLLRNPTFSGGVTVPVAGEGVQTGFDLGVAQDFLGLLLLSARNKVASAELDATELRVADSVLRTTFAVQAAYYALLAAGQVLAMRRTVLETGDAAVALAQAQHAAGNISDLDLVNQRTTFEQLRTDVKRSEADIVVAREALARLLGLWGADVAFHVPPKLPDLPPGEAPLEHLEAIAIGHRLDLASAHARSQALSHAAAMAKNYRFLGSAGVGVNFERSPERYSALTPNASLELPVFDQKQATVARAEALVRQAQAREAALAVDIRSEVRVAHARLVALRDVVDRYAKVVVPLREQLTSLSQQQYSAMLLGAYQLLAAKQNEVNAYREFIEALRDYWLARVDLERAIGAVTAKASPVTPSSGAKP
jgi:cobalt-zinc-cadmium efflux system outer membrane protein